MATISGGGVPFNAGIQATETAFAGEARGSAKAQEHATELQAAQGDNTDAQLAATDAADAAKGNDAAAAEENADVDDSTDTQQTPADTADLSFNPEGGNADQSSDPLKQQQDLRQQASLANPRFAQVGTQDTQTEKKTRQTEVKQAEDEAAQQADEESTAADGASEQRAEQLIGTMKSKGHQMQAMEGNTEEAIVHAQRGGGRRKQITPGTEGRESEKPTDLVSEHDEALRNDAGVFTEGLESAGVRFKGVQDQEDREEGVGEADREKAGAGAAGSSGGGSAPSLVVASGLQPGDQSVEAVDPHRDTQQLFNKCQVGRDKTLDLHRQLAHGDVPSEPLTAAQNILGSRVGPMNDGKVPKSQAGIEQPPDTHETRQKMLQPIGTASPAEAVAAGDDGRHPLDHIEERGGGPLEPHMDLEASIA